jgi:hypothetical protein
MPKEAKAIEGSASIGRWTRCLAARSELPMHNKTHNGNGRKSASLNPEDVFGMFEAGLAELSLHFAFDAVNTATGVRLEIEGLERIDHSDESWSLRVRPKEQGNVLDDETGSDLC